MPSRCSALPPPSDHQHSVQHSYHFCAAQHLQMLLLSSSQMENCAFPRYQHMPKLRCSGNTAPLSSITARAFSAVHLVSRKSEHSKPRWTVAPKSGTMRKLRCSGKYRPMSFCFPRLQQLQPQQRAFSAVPLVKRISKRFPNPVDCRPKSGTMREVQPAQRVPPPSLIISLSVSHPNTYCVVVSRVHLDEKSPCGLSRSVKSFSSWKNPTSGENTPPATV